MPLSPRSIRHALRSLALFTLLAGYGNARAQPESPILAAPPDSLALVAGPEVVRVDHIDDPLPTRIDISHGGDSWALRMIGSGLRKKMMFKVYVAVLYVDASADLGPDPARAVCQQDIARRMILVVKRDLDAARIADAISRGFIDNVWKAPPDSLLAARLDEYISFFGGELKDGECLEVTYLPGHGMFTRVSGAAKPIITEPRLAQGIWGIWLGDTPISEDLRSKLVSGATPMPERTAQR